MLEPAVIVLRLAQYLGAMILMGSSLFCLYAAHGGPRRMRPVLAGAAAVLALASAMGLVAQTSIMAGSLAEGLKPDSLKAVLGGMDLGKAGLIRTLAALAALAVVIVAGPGRRLWTSAGLLGAVAVASFAWSGHGAATEGAGQVWHLISDIAHGWAAALWVGALVGFSLLLRPRDPSLADATALHGALHRFGGLGSGLVAVLIATGVVNSVFLIGLDHVDGLWTTAFGQLLSLKILLFVAMLGLAAANRFLLTPGLGRVLDDPAGLPDATSALRRSLVVETVTGVAILALVAWFGTLAPPASL